MILNERQRTAESLAREIQRLGAWVCSPLPLNDFNRLRYQVRDCDRAQVMEKLSTWGWSPTWRGSMPRITPAGFEAASLFEIDIPLPRTAVPDDRIAGEVAPKEKIPLEVLAMRKYLGWKT